MNRVWARFIPLNQHRVCGKSLVMAHAAQTAPLAPFRPAQPPPDCASGQRHPAASSGPGIDMRHRSTPNGHIETIYAYPARNTPCGPAAPPICRITSSVRGEVLPRLAHQAGFAFEPTSIVNFAKPKDFEIIGCKRCRSVANSMRSYTYPGCAVVRPALAVGCDL
jgi:hypothetical protein